MVWICILREAMDWFVAPERQIFLMADLMLSTYEPPGSYTPLAHTSFQERA